MKFRTLLLSVLLLSLPVLTPAYAAGHTTQQTKSHSKSHAKPSTTKHKTKHNTKRSAKRTSSTANAGTGAFSCSGLPRYCKGMSSCAQAKFALNKCGRKKLDRDNDGIPCENVCG
ncbi:MAG: excalibur calcium-binding domain-containing protein [Aeromonas sp.]